MISNADFAALTVRHIIFHDIPRNPKGGQATPTLTDTETSPDASRVAMLKTRLTQVFSGRASYEVEFHPDSHSPVPAIVRKLTARAPTSTDFIANSRALAQYLFEQQDGSVSPGLVCVLAVASNARLGISIMKLERHQGADLHLRVQGAHSSFEMSVLDNLVLTDNTRLFKSALFLTNGTGFDCLACDTQNDPFARADVAKFWLTFLGCRFVTDPAITTRQWFEASVEFVNHQVSDPVTKHSMYEHLISELSSNRQTVSPRKFIEDYVKRDLRQPYEDHLKAQGVSLRQFSKNTEDIAPKLRRLSYHTTEGISVTAPADKEDLIKVEPSQILVRDKLRTISRK
jgi:hypothetical protein